MTTISHDILKSTIRDLPALPAVVMELIDSLGRDDLSAEQLATKLSHDQALTAKTLRLANSSFYGVPRKVASISEAVSILGMRTVRTVVTAAALTGSFKKDNNRTSLDFDALWRHSIATALCAKGLAEALEQDGESAFTLGLLHDIGRLVLATSFSRQYQAALNHQRVHDCLPQEAELATLGLDHSTVGGCITEHWRFAPAMVEAVTSHHAPAESTEITLAGLVHVADNIAHGLGLSRLDDDIVPKLNPHVWSAMKLSPTQCHRIFTQAQAQFDGLCQALLMSGNS